MRYQFNSIQFNSNSYLMQPEYGDLAMQAVVAVLAVVVAARPVSFVVLLQWRSGPPVPPGTNSHALRASWFSHVAA
jgi:hypothetical protein